MVRVRWVWFFLDLPREGFEGAVDFWRGVTRSGLSAWRGDGDDFATLLPESGDPWLKVQRVGGAGGVHFDLDVDDPGAGRDAAVAAGATVVHEELDEHGLELVVCRSPGGLPFCLTRWAGSPTSGELVREGQESLVDQVCLDIPPSRYAAEVGFWSELTGLPVSDAGSPEFDRLEPGGAVPVRFLLQRLDSDEPVVGAHLDLACADTEQEVARHVGLGAERLRDGDEWVVMRDPVGREYCCTTRHPTTGQVPQG